MLKLSCRVNTGMSHDVSRLSLTEHHVTSFEVGSSARRQPHRRSAVELSCASGQPTRRTGNWKSCFVSERRSQFREVDDGALSGFSHELVDSRGGSGKDGRPDGEKSDLLVSVEQVSQQPGSLLSRRQSGAASNDRSLDSFSEGQRLLLGPIDGRQDGGRLG